MYKTSWPFEPKPLFQVIDLYAPKLEIVFPCWIAFKGQNCSISLKKGWYLFECGRCGTMCVCVFMRLEGQPICWSNLWLRKDSNFICIDRFAHKLHMPFCKGQSNWDHVKPVLTHKFVLIKQIDISGGYHIRLSQQTEIWKFQTINESNQFNL